MIFHIRRGNIFSVSLDELLQGQIMLLQFPIRDVGVNGILG